MSEEKDDGVFSSKWFAALVYSALLAGLGGNVASLNRDTSDRYHGSDAAKDFQSRDRRLEQLEYRIGVLEATSHSHLEHSAEYTQIVRENQKDIDRLTVRVREIERKERGK